MQYNAKHSPTALGIALVRISLGVMFLAHGLVLKVGTFGLAHTAGYFVSLGLPAWTAYATIAAEALGGAALVLGIQARWVALLLSPVLLGALAVHAGNGWVFTAPGGGWVFTAPGGGWEYPLHLLVLSVAQFLLGDGAYALAPSKPLPRLGLSQRRPAMA